MVWRNDVTVTLYTPYATKKSQLIFSVTSSKINGFNAVFTVRLKNEWHMWRYEPCKNGWTDRHAVWIEDLGGPKGPCTRWGFRSPIWEGAILRGKDMPADLSPLAVANELVCRLRCGGIIARAERVNSSSRGVRSKALSPTSVNRPSRNFPTWRGFNANWSTLYIRFPESACTINRGQYPQISPKFALRYSTNIGLSRGSMSKLF